ncbi:MAG: hypothetical protein L6R41_007480, partial [Letrouitia leprolyta]
MPNRYSHAFVLSRYEARGFISPSYESYHSPESSEHGLSLPSTDGAASPPLTAVPALSSDSSTTSTISSLGEPPAKPLHSASSSIITEVYAPQSPAQSLSSSPVTQLEKAPARQHKEELNEEDVSSNLPRSEIPPCEPPRPASRFSSFHNFSAFLNPPPPPERRRRQSYKYDRNPPSSRSRQCFRTSAPKSEPASSRPSSVQKQSCKPKHYTSYKRLEPTFDIESLDSLHFSSEDEGKAQPGHPPPPNIDVIPWEYTPLQPSELAAHHARETLSHLPKIHPKPHHKEDRNIQKQQSIATTPSPNNPLPPQSSIRSHPNDPSPHHNKHNHNPTPSADDDFTLYTDPLPQFLDDHHTTPTTQPLSRSS